MYCIPIKKTHFLLVFPPKHLPLKIRVRINWKFRDPYRILWVFRKQKSARQFWSMDTDQAHHGSYILVTYSHLSQRSISRHIDFRRALHRHHIQTSRPSAQIRTDGNRQDIHIVLLLRGFTCCPINLLSFTLVQLTECCHTEWHMPRPFVDIDNENTVRLISSRLWYSANFKQGQHPCLQSSVKCNPNRDDITWMFRWGGVRWLSHW